MTFQKRILGIGLVILLAGCGGIRAPGLLNEAQLEALAEEVVNPEDPELKWAEKITEEQWWQLKRFIFMVGKRSGYKQGWREGWDARGETHER